MRVDENLEQLYVRESEYAENRNNVRDSGYYPAGLTLKPSPNTLAAQVKAERNHEGNQVDHQYDRNLAELAVRDREPFRQRHGGQKQQADGREGATQAGRAFQAYDYAHGEQHERQPYKMRRQLAANRQGFIDHLENGLSGHRDAGTVGSVQIAYGITFLQLEFVVTLQFKAYHHRRHSPVYPLHQIALLLVELHVGVVGIEVHERSLDESAPAVTGRIRTPDYVVVTHRELVGPRLETLVEIAVHDHVGRQFAQLHPLIRGTFEGLFGEGVERPEPMA